VQRIRQSIEPFNQARADWLIIDQLAQELGVDLGFQRSASAIFRELTAHVPAYAGLSYPALKDESKPVQAAYTFGERDISDEIAALREAVKEMDESAEKITKTPAVGHKLFAPGTLTGKTPQFGYLASGNEMPETRAVSPLYQISLSSGARG
jgi:NADH dehydrogenase/NADH:ubiquinone oxidoreductase subunit G